MITRRDLLLGAAATGALVLLPRSSEAGDMTLLRLPVEDHGPVLIHGNTWDKFGCREPSVFVDQANPDQLLMYYDGCASPGWIACLAVSDDAGLTWVKKGRRLRLGPAGTPYDASASSPWVLPDNQTTVATKRWRMFYLGAAAASATPNFIPIAPYYTLTATAASPTGPWDQSPARPLFRAGSAGVWQPGVGSPGPVIRSGGWWRMFYTAGRSTNGAKGWGIGQARAQTLDGPWTYSPDPIIPPTERAENASVFRDPITGLWWLFTNHIATDDPTGQRGFYGQSVYAYWSADPVVGWSAANRAVVIDGTSSPWTRNGAVGMATVTQVGPNRLAILYDANGRGAKDHMNRDVGVAYASLPLGPV